MVVFPRFGGGFFGIMVGMAVILNISGGKDSTALYLLALDMGVDFRAVFADTGHEHEVTYDYIRRLPERTGGPVVEWVRADLTDKFVARREAIRAKWPADGVSAEWIERACAALQPTGNPFLDMCMLKGGFPGGTRRFCTETLKVLPLRRQVYEPIIDAGDSVKAWHGVRADESRKRACYERMAIERWGRGKYVVTILRQLLDWTVEDVFAQHRRHGLEPNPLYKMGATRVGCAPCIYARNAEVRMWADKFPAVIDKLREWEAIVNACGKGKGESTFFKGNRVRVPGPINFRTHGIDAKVSAVAAGSEDLPLEGGCVLPGLCE